MLPRKPVIRPVIRNPDILAEFERNWIASQPLDFERNLRIADAMLALARDLGQWPRPDPLEGIEKDIELSRLLRRVKGVPQRCTESS